MRPGECETKDMSSIVVRAEDWKDPELRRATLKEARKTARGSRTRVFIKIEHAKRFRVLIATVDGRYYRG